MAGDLKKKKKKKKNDDNRDRRTSYDRGAHHRGRCGPRNRPARDGGGSHRSTSSTEHGTHRATGFIASGRSAATFALIAGISLAFLSGRQRVLRGGPRRAAVPPASSCGP